jgi:septal ring factor EnvC (AmiA/AmiB activator)
MANKRGLGDLIREEAQKTAAPAEENSNMPVTVEADVTEVTEPSANADLAEKDQTIAKLEQSLAKAKTELEAAQKEVLRLIDENKQLRRVAKPGVATTAISPVPKPSGEMVIASGISIAYAHKRGKVLIPDLVVNQDAENNKDFAANAWML